MKSKQSSKTYLFIQLFIALVFFISFLSACAGMHGSHRAEKSTCNMDIDCGINSKCKDGVCTGGISPAINGECKSGHYGKSYCTNTGNECNNSSQCW